MKKVLFALFAFAFLCLMPLAAADSESGVTPDVITAILGAAIFGIPMSGLIEIVKRVLLKIFPAAVEEKWLGYVTSGIVVAVLDVVTLAGLSMFNVRNAIVAWLIAFAVANGWYKVTVKAPAEKIAKMAVENRP